MLPVYTDLFSNFRNEYFSEELSSILHFTPLSQQAETTKG